MDEENRLKITLWLKPGIVRRMDGWLEEDNCKSRGEFAEKALRFYMGYLATEDTSEYLSRAMVDTLRGTLADDDRRELRAYAVDEVLRTNGKIRFDDAIDLQRQVYPDG